MTKSKFFTSFLVFASILITFSSPGIVRNALAQPQNPPTLSSEGEKLPESFPEVQIISEGDGPATDDLIPDGDLPAQLEPPLYSDPDFSINSDSWIGSIPHGLQADSPQSGMGIQSTVLWNNGPLVTHPGGGYNGADASRLQANTLTMNTLGFGNQLFYGNHMADDFEVTSAGGWQIENITFFTYQTGTYAYPPISTITGVYLQIWDGPPDSFDSSIIFGDLVTNRLLDTYWTGIYRDSETSPLASNRPIMTAVASLNISLPEGVYWLDWMIDGSLSSGPWAPPITILGQHTTGNALQYDSSIAAWAPANDSSTLTQQGMPFVIEGTISDWLWDQPMSATYTYAYANQEFPDLPTYSSFLSDDFIVDETWKIDTIFVPGDGWNGFSSLENATALTWQIYADDGGTPAGDPSGGGAAPVWSLTLLPSNLKVTLSAGHLGNLSNTLLYLPTPLKLNPGRYWLVFYPTLNFSPFGQFGLHGADTNNGAVAKFINPNGGFGYGTEWQDWYVTGALSHDFAFSIGGIAGYSWKSISPISLARSRPAAATVNGKIYLFGGEISGGAKTGTVERYNPSTNTWTTLAAAMPDPASNICAAVIGTDIYIPGGYGVAFTYLNTLRVFHTSTNSWSVITTDPLPVGLSGTACAVLNNKLYAIGGNSSGTAQASVYVYDPMAAAGSRWSTIASLNSADAYHSAVTIGGKIYVLGGYYCPTCVEVYNPSDSAWHVVSNLTASRGGAGIYGIGTTLYACGGGWNTYLDTCESYDTTQGYAGAWQPHPSIMIEGRRTFAYTSIGPVMYAIAGWRNVYLQTAERWSFDTYLPLIIK